MVKRFTLSFINRDGYRQIVGPNQGHKFKDTREEAEALLASFNANNNEDALRQVFGLQAIGTFAVSEIECYRPGGDAINIYPDNP